MKRIGILHVTDLHLTEEVAKQRFGTVKDQSVSEMLRNEACPNIQETISRIQDILHDKTIDILACTGDLSDRFSVSSLENGVQFIGQLADRMDVPRNRTFVCPGNHDLDQKADTGKELDLFKEMCLLEEFQFPPSTTEPLLYNFMDGNSILLPIVGLNTCLGGTEHSIGEVPMDYWKHIRNLMKQQDADAESLNELDRLIKDKLIALDIPAVGNSQLTKVIDFINEGVSGNAVLVLGHHNLLPTHSVDLRPYSSMIDSGKVLYRLMEKERRIVYLHGHSHSDTNLLAYSPGFSRTGIVASIGGGRVFASGGNVASFIDIFLSDSNNFLRASVTHISRNGADIMSGSEYTISDRPKCNPFRGHEIDISNLPKDKAITFDKAKSLLNIYDNNALADILLHMSSTMQVSVRETDKPSFDEWTIVRN